jgi:ubiquinone/menaquinone biosynthesis C-methylase UbiE
MYKIPKKEYFIFLESKGHNCIIKSYKNLYELKEKENYISSNSNNQIKFLVTQIYKTKNITYFNYLIILFTHFLSFNDSFKLLDLIKNKKITDTQIMSIVSQMKDKNKSLNTNYSMGEACKKQIFGFEYLKMKMEKIIKINRNAKYLDIGCGDGRKTNLISKIFNIKKHNVYGTDIEIWGPYLSNKKFNFDFKYILKNEKLDYLDNSFDMITCILTLHHIKNLDVIISEIHRILKPNGIFILIEHDILNYMDNLIVDIQHTFFAFLYDNNKNYIKNPYYSNYFNNMEFEYIFTHKHKFKLIENELFCQTIDMQKRYDAQFFQLYKKLI